MERVRWSKIGIERFKGNMNRTHRSHLRGRHLRGYKGPPGLLTRTQDPRNGLRARRTNVIVPAIADPGGTVPSGNGMCLPRTFKAIRGVDFEY